MSEIQDSNSSTPNQHAARLPERHVMTGRLVSLAPIDPDAHARALYDGTHGPHAGEIWRYLSDGPFSDFDEFYSSLWQKAASNDPLYFSVLDNRSGEVRGYAAYLRITPAHRVIEVGSILYTRALQRSTGATEAMYLMARYAFEDLGYRRYEWKCDAQNAPSRQAALRLGFTFEGVFRQHMIVKGRNRDTAWFSMLDNEWPERRAAFEAWLDPSNFDREGRQRKSLGEFRNDRG